MYNKFRLWAPPFFHFLECILALAFYTSTIKGDNPFLADLAGIMCTLKFWGIVTTIIYGKIYNSLYCSIETEPF
jgi:hypothetical protein